MRVLQDSESNRKLLFRLLGLKNVLWHSYTVTIQCPPFRGEFSISEEAEKTLWNKETILDSFK